MLPSTGYKKNSALHDELQLACPGEVLRKFGLPVPGGPSEKRLSGPGARPFSRFECEAFTRRLLDDRQVGRASMSRRHGRNVPTGGIQQFLAFCLHVPRDGRP